MVGDPRIAWLAGIVDGEGCFLARWVNHHAHQAQSDCLEVRLQIDSVSAHLIEEVERIWTALDIPYIRDKARMRPLSTRPAVRVRVTRKVALRTLILALLPYLVVKHAEAERLLHFLEASCSYSHYHLQPKDRTLVDDLRALKRLA